MDPQPQYLTAEQLGIEQWEYDGLIVLERRLRGRALMLDMHAPYVSDSDAPAACIGCWLFIISGKGQELPPIGKKAFSRPLVALFYPGSSRFYAAIDIEGADAIRNFLVTGSPQWDRVIPELVAA